MMPIAIHLHHDSIDCIAAFFLETSCRHGLYSWFQLICYRKNAKIKWNRLHWITIIVIQHGYCSYHSRMHNTECCIYIALVSDWLFPTLTSVLTSPPYWCFINRTSRWLLGEGHYLQVVVNASYVWQKRLPGRGADWLQVEWLVPIK